MSVPRRVASPNLNKNSLLESLAVLQDGNATQQPLLLAVRERFLSLKQCLDAAAARRPSTAVSEHVWAVWRCRALLFELAVPERAIHTRLDVAGDSGASC